MSRRCKSVTSFMNKMHRCEGERGHYSAHYNGRLVWNNAQGLPIQRMPPIYRNHRTAFVVGFLVAVLVITGAVMWFVIHH